VHNAIKEYGKCNLGVISVEVMSQYLHTVIIPQITEKKVRGEENSLDASSNESKVQAVLSNFGLACICLSMVNNWIRKLGFNHEPC
jgi:hypothetical protein